jgi:hypothetical protein
VLGSISGSGSSPDSDSVKGDNNDAVETCTVKIGTLGYHPPRPAGRVATPPALKPPKLAMVSVRPGKNSIGGFGASVTHHMTNGGKKSFVFTDPMKFGQHLARLGRSQWRQPGKNEAAAVVHQLDMG